MDRGVGIFEFIFLRGLGGVFVLGGWRFSVFFGLFV